MQQKGVKIMTKRIKIGNVYAILLPDGTYVFGKNFKDGCVGFYKERALNKKNLPKYERLSIYSWGL